MAEAKTEEEIKAEETAKAEEEAKKTSFEEKDGNVIVPVDVFESYKNDMHKYKGQRNELRTENEKLSKQVENFSDVEKEKKEEDLKKNQQFEELAKVKEGEVAELKKAIENQSISSELKTIALQMGITNVEDIKLADMESVVFNAESKIVEGAKEAIEKLKSGKPYLFESNSPIVDTGRPGAVPENLTKEMLVHDGALAMKVKKENPALYSKLMNKG